MRSCLVLLAFSLLAAAPAGALEKRSLSADQNDPSGWSRSASCAMLYYNRCTAWMWAWSGWAPGDRVGATFESCNDHVTAVFLRTALGAPPGYGYTGSIQFRSVDANGCPADESWGTVPFLPASDWNVISLYAPAPHDLAVVVVLGPAAGNPVEFLTDHPAIGPTGPIACGHCYPVDRVTHSFWWGPASSPLCPGSPFFDGFCNAELLMRVDMGPPPLAVEDTSWGRLKALFR